MYEQQSDSDEDCAVYFLKPVNEYNIADKIKEANKELFAAVAAEEKNAGDNRLEAESDSTMGIVTITSTATMRKVTFAANLEDYEPESPTNIVTEHFADDDTAVDMANTINCVTKSTEITIFPTINEEEQTAILQECWQEEKETINVSTHENPLINADELTVFNGISQLKTNLPTVDVEVDVPVAVAVAVPDDDDDVDEICEEIIVMEMESNTATTTQTLGTTLPNDDNSFRRAIVKQATFDCDEQDNRSLMNLLTASDAEEDDDSRQNDDDDDHDGDDANTAGIDDGDEFNNIQDDDDDQLSLIVASYLPDDFERAISISPTSPAPLESFQKSGTYFKRKTSKVVSGKSSSSSAASYLGKRFQLRRKAHSSNSIGIGASNVTCDGSARNDDIIGLKLNYKTCCEYRNSIQGKLPKYTGYLSEYGLSREQLQQREQKLHKKQRFVLEQAMKTNEHEMRKMQDNERAFTTWLRNKMRYPINKTRNMFDVKLRLTGKKKPSPGNDSDRHHTGLLGCAAKLKTNS